MDLNIQHEDEETRGRFYADLDETHQAEMTYVKLNPEMRICDHTGVPTAYEGRGIAFELLKALVADARENNLKYVPLCPYVAVQFKRHPEWSDVFVEG